MNSRDGWKGEYAWLIEVVQAEYRTSAMQRRAMLHLVTRDGQLCDVPAATGQTIEKRRHGVSLSSGRVINALERFRPTTKSKIHDCGGAHGHR